MESSMDQNWFKQLDGRKFLEGRSDQVKDYNEAFTIRKNVRGYYISWKTGEPVENIPFFSEWSEARAELISNWRKYLDDKFEKEILCESD